MFSVELKLKDSITTGVHPESSYKYTIRNINDKKVAIVHDNDKEEFMSVTNNIENIADDLDVKRIIYRDSDGVYDYWSRQIGFRSLSHQGNQTVELRKALKIAKICYLN